MINQRKLLLLLNKGKDSVRIFKGSLWCLIGLWCLFSGPLMAQETNPPADTVQTDSTITDYQPSIQPSFRLQDRYGNPFSTPTSPSPFQLTTPAQLDYDIQVGDSTINYSLYERINGLDFRAPTNLSFDEYSQYQNQQIKKDYFKTRSIGLDGESAVSGKRLIPPIYTTPIFDRLFGGSFVDIRPNGFVTLDFGGRFQRIDNPQVPLRQQRNGNFEFDQQISLNVVGKIGDKLAVTANFDNNNSFDFQNNVKVEYTGYEEEIIQKIELGNVSLPVSNSLITGSQSLFGLKTQLQFGKLFVTSVASVQRGQSDAITIESGSQNREFELRASDYDENRHFFLGHFFRKNYENWLNRLPQITSGLNVTRVEVYVLNRNNNTETLRNIAGFMDLAEGETIYRDENPNIMPAEGAGPTRNSANQLFNNLINSPAARDINQVNEALTQDFNLVKATDFEIITSARKLTDREFTFNSQLGYISLNRKLQNDEVLAVAFEYTYQGQRYKVGELTEDYQNLGDDKVIFLKLLRPSKINPEVPTWELMMKNIYSLNATQIEPLGFQFRVVYRDDRTGIDNPSLQEGELANEPLVRLLGLDQLNQNNDPQPDGNFDFVEGVTINSDLGIIIFPVLQPFGNHLEQLIRAGAPEEDLVNKYVYDALYETTKADAELITTKNKYFLTGSFQAGSANEIMLPGFNIAEGSVQVIAGNTPLTENVDFTVDYNLGKVTIINEGVLSSGKRIQIQFEKADLFNFQQRTLLGTRLDYRFNDDINLGATVLHLNERPVVTRVAIGSEPTKNTKYGFDFNYRKESRFLTKMVDLLPIVQTKEPSSITINAEFAQLIPGTSNVVDGDGTSYIDDFENTNTPFNLGGWQNWQLAATPITDDERFIVNDELGEGYRRAKLAWYIVDNSAFYIERGNLKPSNIGTVTNHYERAVRPQEIFPNQNAQVVNPPLPVLDMVYFPEERGPYNYNPNLSPEGRLPNPEDNWGGVTRAITSEVDFDKTNIEYLEFWLLDPFISGENGQVIDENNTTGGQLVFNLGSISEDVIPDDRHFFENGLPEDYNEEDVVTDEWGRAPADQFLTDFFNNSSAEIRSNQDVGFEGVRNDDEANYFSNLISRMPAAAQTAIQDDPSADNFQYYLGPELDERNAQIIERYKNFNGQEGNTPILSGNERYTPSGTQKPDNEDLNRDNTLSDLEEYYEYTINLRPGQLNVGQNYIVDKTVGQETGVTWYLFRIPIRQPERKVGNIQGFKSIRYIRTYMTGWRQKAALRFVKFQFVGSQWRRYTEDLNRKGLNEYTEPYDPNFTISVVNIEENATNDGEGSPYMVPPGIIRDRDNTSPIDRRVNEQSLQLCVEDLKDGDARAAYKNMTLDLINYGKIRMFLHAESQTAEDSTVQAFLRLGTDFTENYYEVAIPLVMSEPGVLDERVVWPEENELDIDLNDLYAVKSKRNNSGDAINLPYTEKVGRNIITVVGRPELSTVQTVMIGIRNPQTPDRAPKDVCIWANELRVGDFDRTSGWAANARINAQLADVANITASARHMTFGFGGVQSRISERSREEATEYDVSANVTVDKFLPQKLGLKIPMFVSYEKGEIEPQFDPRDPDIPLEAALSSMSPTERAEYRQIVTDQVTRRSLNFTNVRKIKLNENARSNFFDLSNFSFSYSYSDIERTNFNTALYSQKIIRGGIGYNYSFPDVNVQPFANVNLFNSPWLALIKDFNFSPLPSTISIRGDLNRTFVKTLYRGADLNPLGEALYEKAFTFNRIYDMRWNLTQSLSLDYGARAFAIIDEPFGELDSEEKRDTVFTNLKQFGRMKNFDQNLTATYTVPFDKLPLTDWISADVRYSAGYTWRAGALGFADTLGNTIENSRTQELSSRIDMVSLYNKAGLLREINSPSRGRARRPQPATPPQNNADSTAQEKPERDAKFAKGFLRLLMSLRSVNGTYNLSEGTLLPGYMPEARFFGMDSVFSAPGLPFLLGSQDPEIRNEAVSNGWLTTSSALTMPFQQSRVENINVSADIEPFQDFRIKVDFKKTKTGTYQEIYQLDSIVDPRTGEVTYDYVAQNPARIGNYNISALTLRTAFAEEDAENNSEIFREFEQNRAIIQARLERENPNPGSYDLNGQDVLIPAFLAAYTGQDANDVKLSPFPKIPLPNWRVDYAGLPRLIPELSDVFLSFNISHGYISNYSVSNYTSNLLYGDESLLLLSRNVEDYPLASQINDNDQGTFAPVYIIQQVTITERFSPLIGLNVRTRSRLTGRVSYDIERSLALNMSNTQVTELNSKSININFGFTKSELTLPFRVEGRTVTLENDLTFNMGMTFKDTKTVQRKLDEESTVTNGNINFQLRPTLDYNVNEKLNIQLYFARTLNDPRVTNSFKRTTTEFGVQARFNLAQ